jgi:Bacterial virulence factor lipase N-terminal
MQNQRRWFLASVVTILMFVPCVSGNDSVRPLFELSAPEAAPFPSDWFTVADTEQNTGRRVALPMPSDCSVNRSDCEDIAVLNLLDGFHQSPRLSIPFDGPIDVDSATSRSIFLLRLGSTLEEDYPGNGVVGINQVIWDTLTNSLHLRSHEALDEHTRYALIVTTGLLDASGAPVQASETFRRFRHTVRGDYKKALLDAMQAAHRVGVREDDIVVASVFTTQSATYLARRIHDQIFEADAPAPADFNIGPSGSRAVYRLDSISSVTFNRQLSSGPALTPVTMDLFPVRYVPGAIDRVAFGRFESPDYMVHPGDYIPEIASRTGVPVPRGRKSICFNLYLPSGPMPVHGWPVAITGHGGGGHKNFNVDSSTSIPASHGLAVIAINAVGHGQGSLSTLTITRTDGTTVTLGAGGRGADQNGDGVIGATEGFTTTGVRRIRDRADAFIQTAADLMQLVRVIQAGVDVDDDGRNDLDPSRITYYGHSFGAIYGIDFVAVTPEVRAAVFSATSTATLETSSRNPAARPGVGTLLNARTPSLLNSPYGLTTIDGVSIAPGPTFDENQPLRDTPAVINTIPGAIAIQQFLERSAWLGRFGDPEAFAPLFQRRPPGGLPPRPVLIQFARGDQNTQNPGTSAILRAGALEHSTALYRHDLFYPTVPLSGTQKNPHGFAIVLRASLAPWLPIVSGAQEQIAQFLASEGATVIVPSPAAFWEVPASTPLPETLAYIP